MKIFDDAGLWHCIEPREGQIIDPDLDKRTLPKINLSLKPSVAKITKRCETALGAWNCLQRGFESNTIVRMIKVYSNLFSIHLFQSLKIFPVWISMLITFWRFANNWKT